MTGDPKTQSPQCDRLRERGMARSEGEDIITWGEDTIVAISTAVGAGAIGIVRMSGPQAIAIAEFAFQPARGAPVGPNDTYRLLYGHVIDPEDHNPVDEVLLALMRAPRSYTREDVIEFHSHGGLAAQRAVLRLMIRLGARLAEPGEFTKRAFMNGRIDLTQAESVAAIVAARSSGALRASVRQLEGGLRERLRSVRRELLGLLAQIEVTLDFSDEDVDVLDWTALANGLSSVRDDLVRLLKTAFVGRALEQGVRTAIIGKPNVGKSSLLNALLMRERAIVSDIPGTTRDTIEELMEIGGIPVHLVDTAGIRNDGDHVEQLGVERSLRAMEQADLVLAVFDLSAPWDESDTRLLAGLDRTRSIVVANKSDLVAGVAVSAAATRSALREYGKFEDAADNELGALREAAERVTGLGGISSADNPKVEATNLNENGQLAQQERSVTVSELPRTDESCVRRICVVSTLTGEGLEELRLLIQQVVTGGEELNLEEPVLATERQRSLVGEALKATEAALLDVRNRNHEELLCEEIRVAIGALGRITGEELTPDLLDEIFSRFCLGK